MSRMNDPNKAPWSAWVVALGALGALSGCDLGPPEVQPTTPQYRSVEGVEPGSPASGERGSMMITELGWAGSVSDEGVWDPNDVFIELQNRSSRPVNLSNWRVIVEGDYVETHRVPTTLEPVAPGAFFVIAAKKEGAYGERADVIIPELKLGKTFVLVELRDADRRLQESVGSTRERVFNGGYDTYGARSMERVQLIFGNQGNISRSWHANGDLQGFETVAEGWRERTFATPGEANSPDYSGSSWGGNFD